MQTPFELRNIRKHFGGVQALRGVDLSIPTGQIVGLAGENGAGKSTLLKVLSGIYRPDGGEVLYDDVKQEDLTPAAALAAGVAAVAQELSLFEHLSVAENISLGNEPMIGPFVSKRKLILTAEESLEEIGANIDPEEMVRNLSFSDKQMVEVAKALSSDPRLLILDEPTSGLRESEVERLLKLMMELRSNGTSIIFITHRMNEMFAVCDTFTVLRDGESIGSVPASDATPEEIVRMMVGRDLGSLYPPRAEASRTQASPLLSTIDLTIPGTPVRDVSLKVRPGEIVAIAGLAGNGQNELLEAIAGIRRANGSIQVGDVVGPFKGAQGGQNAGVWLVPEDRKSHGLILDFSIEKNLTLPIIKKVSTGGVLSAPKELKSAESAISRMSIRPADPHHASGSLSGGNQQKVVIGKSLLVDPKLFLFADPTRGIDVGTKQEIYRLMRTLTGQGKGILFTSSDLTETVGMADRVVVLSSGRVVAELKGDEVNEVTIAAASFSGQAAS